MYLYEGFTLYGDYVASRYGFHMFLYKDDSCHHIQADWALASKRCWCSTLCHHSGNRCYHVSNDRPSLQLAA